MNAKQITIFSVNLEPIVIEDVSSKNIKEYTKELSNLLESNNVTILHTSSGSMVIRPNVISAIIVSDINTSVQETPQKKKSEKSENKSQDIIKD